MKESKNPPKQITLIDLFAVLWARKWLVIGVTVIGMLAVLVFSVATLMLPVDKNPLPNKYSTSAHMLINDSNSDSGLSSMLASSGLGSLASMAGVNVKGSSSYSALAGYLVSSNKTLDEIVDHFGLIERYKIEKHIRTESRKALKKYLASNYDEETGVFTISFTDTDPDFACRVTNYVVGILERRFEEMGIDKNITSKNNLEDNIAIAYRNILELQQQIEDIEGSVSYAYSAEGVPSIMMDTAMIRMELEVQENIYAQLKAQYELLKITMSSEQPIFQVLEYAEIPDNKSGPSRGKLCIIVTFASAFFAVFLAFFLDAVSDLRKDPSTVEKFKKR